MKGNIMENTTHTRSTTRPAPRLPRQAAGVDRTEPGVAAAMSERGAEAAFGLGDLLKIGKGLLGF
jgi:hypothetical protein